MPDAIGRANGKTLNHFTSELRRRLDEIQAQGLYRELRRVDSPQSARISVAGRSFLNFSSNDYLGLANHPVLKEAAIRATERFGTGSGASRLICGSLAPHGELEEALAQFKGTEAALSFSSGYATALGTIGALAGRDDVVVIDKLVHASLVDAARLSGAKLRVFAHNDLTELEDILRWSVQRAPPGFSGDRPRTLVVTESVFSMDGDFAPLREMVELKEKYGAWLMLDEAHATGLFGDNGRGRAEESSLADRIEVRMGTLGKALGASGGYVCGPRVLMEFLINRARSFIFSTAPARATAAAAGAAVKLVQSAEGQERRDRLWSLVDRVRDGLAKSGWGTPADRGAIIPLIIGGENEALAAAGTLREQGVFIPAIRHPTVARGEARLRLTLTAAHTAAEVEQLLKAVARIRSP
ncbi:MAG TPA: 8-amino-7-oxononanoate synthase [Verrucomicrobiae bacterium]|nr:8-amino-7-oxononanoate synthase [Verrucomicrobiae bacterium]